jgi:hypothetical protein
MTLRRVSGRAVANGSAIVMKRSTMRILTTHSSPISTPITGGPNPSHEWSIPPTSFHGFELRRFLGKM